MRGKVWLGAAVAALTTAIGGAGVAQADPSVKWNGSPVTSEDDRSFHLSGRLMYDMAYTDAEHGNATGGPTNDSFHTYARRAFLGADGRLTQHWRYNVKFDFTFGSNGSAPNNQATIKADDFYLEYAGDLGSLFIGNSNAVSPMEDRDSSLNIPFNERSFLISAGGFGKKPGLAWLTNGGNWSLGVGVQSNDGWEIADGQTSGAAGVACNATVASSSCAGNEGGFVITRGTYAPFYQQTPEGTKLLAFGITGRYRDNGSNNYMSYSPGALSNKSSNNDSVGAFQKDIYIGGEVAGQWNALGAEAEYGHFDVRDNYAGGGSLTRASDASAQGYYVDVFWSPTGESRKYSASDGSFGAVTPIRPLGSPGGIGHIMLSARYEDMDLTDSNFAGNINDTSAYTLGATWVPVSHVKFQLNYSDTKIDYVNAALTDNDIKAVVLRSQFDW